MVLTIMAKAGVAGNHVFRAEVHCKTAGMRLVREEMTHYYQDGPGMQQANVATRPEAAHDDQRTAERPPLPLPQSPDQPMPTRAINR